MGVVRNEGKLKLPQMMKMFMLKELLLAKYESTKKSVVYRRFH